MATMKSDRRAGLWHSRGVGRNALLDRNRLCICGCRRKGNGRRLARFGAPVFSAILGCLRRRRPGLSVGPRFESLARRGRDFGLAFAAALSVHLGLVVWFCHISTPPFRIGHLAVAELIGAVWILCSRRLLHKATAKRHQPGSLAPHAHARHGIYSAHLRL